MFRNCTSLTTAPSLPATTISAGYLICYGCTRTTTTCYNTKTLLLLLYVRTSLTTVPFTLQQFLTIAIYMFYGYSTSKFITTAKLSICLANTKWNRNDIFGLEYCYNTGGTFTAKYNILCPKYRLCMMIYANNIIPTKPIRLPAYTLKSWKL